ncbi:MAG TPA: acyl-CoA dehydrogenase family protein [Candidatus Binatia bacterium]|jgi:alkylation response protein AidB-like acyl-CoA dehydrogenase|nr:acyl-CoA dehydrogenase family protein [Candidatus Binatia bacterium]
MDMSYTPEEDAFRARVRTWLEANVPPPGSLADDLEAMRAWQRKLHAEGLLAVAWPVEYGGAGFSQMEQAILNEELARVRAPGVVNAMAIWWVGPAIMRYGTEEQKQRFIPKILTADEIWATGYSEPASGSDMAAAATKAERVGDHYVVNGQKIWTTLAHISDWYFVLVRTSNESKWGGLSLMLMDMRSPGVEIRPIRQIDGGSEFNEVFMTDVKVPVGNLLGKEGQGWEVVSSALVNERSGIAGSVRSDQALEWLVATTRGQKKERDPRVRQRIADLAIKGAIMRYAGLRSMTDALRDRMNPHLSAAMKLMGTSLVQEFSETAMEILGPYATLMHDEHAPFGGRWARQYLYDRSMTIAGGTSEVQRNIVAQRVLGMPRR